MQIDYAARGGRVTKWKGMIVSIAPGVLAIVVALHGADAQAQEVTTTLSGTAGPTISGTSAFLAPVNQVGDAELQAIVSSGVISQSTGATSNSVAADVNANAITAGVVSNTASTLVDLSENAASGPGSNTVLATAMRNVANDAFAAIISTSITNSADIGSPSSVGLSDNSLSASVGLSSSTQILQGDIAQGFGNTNAGTMTVDATSNGITAGLSLSVTQLASDVQNDTAGDTTSAFASITGSAVTLTISDATGATAGNTNSLIEAEANRISAAFTGNAATSGINVQADGMPLLSSTAGISSLQDATQVGTDGTKVLTSALVDSASGISIGVAGDVTGTTVTARENTLTASATENTARNTLKLDPGVSVDGQTSYGSLDTSLSATGADVKASDLFVSSVQRTTDSNVSSLVQGDAGVAVSAEGSLSDATLQSINNTLAATTLGNTGVNGINVGEANSLSAMVSATNVQRFQSAADSLDENDPDFIAVATAKVEDATLSLSAATGKGETLTDSTVTLSSNDVTASASANRVVQDVRLAGNVVDAGQASTDKVSPTTTLDATPGKVDLASGISTGNLQITTGESGSPTATVLAQIDGDKTSATLNIGNSVVADRGALASARLALDANTFVAGAVANDATQGLEVNANALTASVAQASQQVLTGGVQADNSDTGLALTAYATTATNVTTSLDGNLISAGATGNLGNNAVSVTANELTVLNALVPTTETEARTVLSSDLEGTGALSATAAISLLNSQSTSTQSTSAILSSLTGATATNSLTASGEVSGVTLSTDANATTSMARANAAQNGLVIDLGSVDMTQALSLSAGTPSAAGTNLAALGSAQVNSSAVTSTIDAGAAGGSAITAGLTAATTVADTAVTANDNRLTSLASGNSVTNNFQLSATNLVTTDTSAPAPAMALSAESAAASTLTISNAALAVGNEQANSGTITSTVGAGSDVTNITASLLGTSAVSDSLVATDGNRVLAQAVAASGATNTATIDATNLTTSALVGSVQINSGGLAARVGAEGSGVLVQASLGASGTASETSLSASENVVGATATALTDTTTLRLGGENTASIAGTGIGTGASASTGTTLALTADYGLAQSQTNSANAGAVTEDVTIATLVGTFTDGAIDSSGNLVLAQASGALGDARLEATAASLAASGATGSSDPVFALAASQTNSGVITGTLTDANITMTAANLGSTTTSETLTLRENSLLASASGVSGTTLLNTSALASAGSVVDGATAAASGTAVKADRMLIAEQTNSGAITATSNGTPSLSMTVTGAADGASLDLGANAVLATATGISGGNTLLNDAGAENAATAALSAVQTGSATVGISALIARPELTMTVGSASTSALALDTNAVTATATGATLANRLITSGATISPADGGTALATTDTDITGASSALYASQILLGDVTAEIDDTGGQPLVKLLSSGAVSNATLSVDGNRLSATATNGQVTNTLAGLSDTLIGHSEGSGGLSLLSMQSATGTTSAAVDSAGVLLAASSTVAGSTLSIDGNASLATATGLSASNRTALEAGTSLTGAAGGDIGVLNDAAIITATSSLLNSQSLAGNVTATIDPTGSDVNGMLLTATGAVSGDSLLSVASNTLRAQATGVSAGNLATVSAGSVTNATTALANDQSSTAALASTLSDPRFGVAASGTVSGSVDVTGNRAIASTTAATATNTLAMTSATLISGSEAGAITLNADDTADLVSGGEPIAALLNRQVTSGDAAATINNTGTNDPVLVSAGAMTGSVAVESNWLVSQSRGNVAENSLSLVAGTTVDGQSQALLASNQNRVAGAISASVFGTGGPVIGAEVASLSGNLSVDNNLVRASGAANTVVNTMAITAAAINVGAAAETALIPSSPSMATNANFAVLNGQQNASSVTAAVTDYDFLAKSTGTASGALSLNGNMVMADATGNSSITTLRLAAAGTAAIAPMAAVTNQINDGAMSATVTGVSFTASAGGTSGTASLAGNSISATSTGNLSSTVVGSPGSVFTSF